jgi:4-amino-4-deoxy-L-arabinose transferase-like glycosyltransferase
MSLAYPIQATARAPFSLARWRRPLLTWFDGIEEGWAVPLLLIAFAAVWSAYFVIAYAGGDLHPDVLETWTLGRSLAWGYAKHPPLMGWAARAWTEIFPLTNWSFQVLAMTNAAIALWSVDLIARRFVRGDKRAVVLLLLLLLPVYQFHAQRFNANAVLLATWPLATYCFLRSFETLDMRWAAAAGASAALAMLGKYYSVFLLASFAFAALCHPGRRAYFTSSAPYVSVATGLVALVPHLYWLATTGAQPFAYALERHAGKALGASLIEASLFVLGVTVLCAVPALVWARMAGQRSERFVRDFQALHPGLRLLLLIGIATVVFPAITAMALRTDMPVIWSLQGLFLFVVVIVGGASFSIDRDDCVKLAGFVMGTALLTAAVIAPAHALYRNSHPLHEGRNFYQPAAEELTRRWHAETGMALTTVGGDDDLAFALAFYSPDHPVYDIRLVHPITERLPQDATFDNGWAAMCFGGDEYCASSLQKVAARAPRFVRYEIIVESNLLGQPGASGRFVAFLVPPTSKPARAPSPSDGVEDFSAMRRTHTKWEGKTLGGVPMD